MAMIFRLRCSAGRADCASEWAGGCPCRPEPIRSSHDTLFTSGTLGRYSKILHNVMEGREAQLMEFFVITIDQGR